MLTCVAYTCSFSVARLIAVGTTVSVTVSVRISLPTRTAVRQLLCVNILGRQQDTILHAQRRFLSFPLLSRIKRKVRIYCLIPHIFASHREKLSVSNRISRLGQGASGVADGACRIWLSTNCGLLDGRAPLEVYWPVIA